MKSIKLSIIIPTRNRYQTLIPIVNTIIENIISYEYEIIIQDNSDDNQEILSYLESINDVRIKYFYYGSQISMVQNTELAIENTKGIFIVFIGDDDLVTPYIMDVVDYINENGIECLTYTTGNYFYKDLNFTKEYGFNKPASLQLPKMNYVQVIELNSEEELDKVLSIGGVYCLNLPRLYHGIVKKDILNKIKLRYGKFVPGPCPDMTLSIALTQVVNKFHYVDYPVTITGVSAKSEGGKGVHQGHVVKISEKEWLAKDEILRWNKKIPPIFTRETIWAQSISHVLLNSSVNKQLNYIELYKNIYFACPKMVIPYVKPLFINELKLMNLNLIHYQIAVLKRIIRKIVFSLPSFVLEFAMVLRGDYLKTKNISSLNTPDECMQYMKNNSKFNIK